MISVIGVNKFLLLLKLILSGFLPFATETILICRFLRVLCWNTVKQGELASSLGLVAGPPLFHPGSPLHSTSGVCIWDSSLQSQHPNSVHTYPTANSNLLAPSALKVCTLVDWSTYRRSSSLPQPCTCFHGSLSQPMAPPSSQLPQRNLNQSKRFLFYPP